jgi:S1-C subfamily serine protease
MKRAIQISKRVALVLAVCVLAFGGGAIAVFRKSVHTGCGHDTSGTEQVLTERRIGIDVAGSIVRVFAITEEAERQIREDTVQSTGFFVHRTGRVLTVLAPSKEAHLVWLEKDGVEYLAIGIGRDESTGLVLLQAVKLPEEFAVIPVTDVVARPALGSRISAASFAPGPTVATLEGEVSGFTSEVDRDAIPRYCLKTTICSGPTDAGAPVVDSNGAFVGVLLTNIRDAATSFVLSGDSVRHFVETVSSARDSD